VRLPQTGNVGAYFLDEQEIRDEHWLVEPGDVVIDVGAALGSYTFAALAMGASRVVAVEPDVGALDKLASLALENGVLDRVTLVCEALYYGPYPSELAVAIKASPHAHLALADDTLFSTLDNLVVDRDLRRLDWTKIDVEGAELGVLRGSQRALAKFHPKLIVEDHTAVYPILGDGAQADEMERLLTTHGYTVTKVSYMGPTHSYRLMWVCS
jgi:FkbM family methyltransferase